MWRKTRKRLIRKRSFLLFELLLAMGLLLLCLFPMIKTHVGIAREEAKQIQAIRREQAIRAALCQLKIDLYEHTYSWEELMKGKADNACYRLRKLAQSTKQTGESGMLLNATLHLGREDIERIVYVEKALHHPD